MFIPANATNVMHVLRHFRAVPDQYARPLLGRPYEYYDVRKKRFLKARMTRSTIARALKTKGKSKFFPQLPGLENPKKVIARVRKEAVNRKLQWTNNGAYRTAKFTFLHTQLVGDDIPERSKRKTRRIGVELAWYKGTRSAYITVYPCFYDL